MQASDVQLTHLRDAVRHAFARDTADRNPYDAAALMNVSRPGPGLDRSTDTLRNWVEQWRREHGGPT